MKPPHQDPLPCCLSHNDNCVNKKRKFWANKRDDSFSSTKLDMQIWIDFDVSYDRSYHEYDESHGPLAILPQTLIFYSAPPHPYRTGNL